LDFQRTQLGSARAAISGDDVFRAVSQRSGVPEETLRGIAQKRDYRRSLGEFILGQDHAVQEVATELGLIKAGLVDAGKPASVMMFVGQTGTGKTEMAKALARFYSNTKRLRTYTLGNMVEPHSVSGIIGVPPGYVGHDRGGKIVQDLNSDPHCVFLLDEADKAHPDVLQPFLNLFDEGWVRDQRGVQAFAHKAIFILTTNVGQRMIADMAKKGKSPEEMAARMKETLAQIKHAKLNRPVFAPEFLARIKRVIVFQPLSRQAVHGICRKLLREMRQHWQAQRDKDLLVDDLLAEAVGEEAHSRNEKSDGKEGGRIVRKLLSEFVEAPLQAAISERPEDYTRCTRVRIAAHMTSEPTAEPNTVDASAESETNGHVRPDQLAVRVEFEEATCGSSQPAEV
jgi:ATP-dependent Clp protease ATP-binding subunit ClpA